MVFVFCLFVCFLLDNVSAVCDEYFKDGSAETTGQAATETNVAEGACSLALSQCTDTRPTSPCTDDRLVGLVVKSGRSGVRIPFAQGFFWVESYQ